MFFSPLPQDCDKAATSYSHWVTWYLDSFKWHFNYVDDYNTVSYLSHLARELKAHLLVSQHHHLIEHRAIESGEQWQGWGTQLDSGKVAECVTLHSKHAPFVLTLWSLNDLHVIRDDCEVRLLSVYMFSVWVQTYGGIRAGMCRHNGLRPSSAFWWPLGEEAMTGSSQQGAEVRSRGNEARSEIGLGGGEECNFFAVWLSINRVLFLIPQVLKFMKAPPLHPCILSPLEHCRQAFIIILIKASGTAFHLQPCRPLSLSGEAVELFIITRLSEMGEGHGCEALEWNLGRTLGDRRAEFDSR